MHLQGLLAGGMLPVSNQVPYNPLWRAIEHTILPRCTKDGIAVLCYSSLQQGLLSGKYSAAAEVPVGKRRKSTRTYEGIGACTLTLPPK